MALETATYIASLVTTNPDGTDQRTTADDHIRLIKATLKRTFPLLDGAVSLSSVQYAYLNDVSRSVQSQLNTLRDGSATANYALYANSASYAANAANAEKLGGFSASEVAVLARANRFSASSAGSSNGWTVNLSNGNPGVQFFCTTAPLNNQSWEIRADSSRRLLFGLWSSDYTSASYWCIVTRTGNSAAIALSGSVTLNGNALLTTASSLSASNLTGSVPNASITLSSVQQHQSSLSVASATNATTATIAANATAVGGFAASVAAAASTVAARDSNGNLFAVYVNQSSAAETGAVTHLMTKQGDNYVRAATPAHAGQYISGQNISGRTGTTKTLSTSAPSGGSNGDIWYRYA